MIGRRVAGSNHRRQRMASGSPSDHSLFTSTAEGSAARLCGCAHKLNCFFTHSRIAAGKFTAPRYRRYSIQLDPFETSYARPERRSFSTRPHPLPRDLRGDRGAASYRPQTGSFGNPAALACVDGSTRAIGAGALDRAVDRRNGFSAAANRSRPLSGRPIRKWHIAGRAIPGPRGASLPKSVHVHLA
jgi:hypothetical protein